jgi:ABC-type transporter Mla subunit MlaD
MRRLFAIACLALGLTGLLAFGIGAGGSGGGYEVRGIFDNGGFLVPGEELRVAGAAVGTVAEVDVTGPTEAAHADGSPEPGKAVVVMRIDDAGFQDFRADASCLIRPQSLLGEKFVDCNPTQPRAPGSRIPPPLAVVPDGQPGAGQRFLPLESNGKEVDLDLVQNIMREPYPDRFRLILNDLGAGLAARGDDLAQIVRRADPALRRTDEVLAVLARQNRDLARLAGDSDAVLAPLARERSHVSGFINNANATATATAERGRQLESGLQKLPPALRELDSTMGQLSHFADQATPVFSDLGTAAPALTRASEALGPFSDAATPALTSLGDAAEQSTQPLVQSDPVIKDLRDLGQAAKPGATALAKLLGSLRASGGFKDLMDFIYSGVGGTNGFDQYGHFLRALLLVTPCVQYVSAPIIGCSANFAGSSSKASAPALPAVPAGSALDANGDPAATGGSVPQPSASAAAPKEQSPPSIHAERRFLDLMLGRHGGGGGR